jgi:mercuric reductase
MAEMRRVRMRVRGMTCSGCEERVARAVAGAGAIGVVASHRRGEVECALPAGTPSARLTEAVRSAGFLPEGLEEIGAPGTASCGCCG